MFKKLIVGSIVLALATSTAFAADKPCKSIASACKKAGYYKGGDKENKGLFKDCIKPIIEGSAVANVTVDSATAQACKAAMMKRQGNH